MAVPLGSNSQHPRGWLVGCILEQRRRLVLTVRIFGGDVFLADCALLFVLVGGMFFVHLFLMLVVPLFVCLWILRTEGSS